MMIALRGMSNLPVPSLKAGGLSWFTDLTVPDPFYILPVATAVTTLVTLEVNYKYPVLLHSYSMASQSKHKVIKSTI